MREIKFRYWIIGENKMSFSENLFMCDPEAGIIQYADQGYYVNNEGRKPEFIIMQYTGLKDMNGKEIYEGDILIAANGQKCSIAFGEYEFKWDDGIPFCSVGFYWEDNISFPFGKSRTGDGSLYEVIGNIHENPELLNQ